MDNPAVAFLQWLRDHDVEFMVRVPGAFYCGESIPASPEEVLRYIEDHDLFAARYHGVSREDYLEWLDAYGVPRCSAMTRSGKPCRSARAGARRLEAREFAGLDRRDLCPVHSRQRDRALSG